LQQCLSDELFFFVIKPITIMRRFLMETKNNAIRLFVNIMGTLSNSRQAVSAQGIVLGVSVIGFLLYALFHRIKSAFVKRVVTVMFPLIMAVKNNPSA